MNPVPSKIALASVTAMTQGAQQANAERAQARYKGLLIDGIVGVGLPTIAFAEYATNRGFADFTGDQHNPAWSWKRDVLEECDTDELVSIYAQAKGAK